MENPYETERVLGEYLLFHYGEDEEILPYPFGPAAALHFAERVVRECVDFGNLPSAPRALDLGCAVGRSSFELASHCPEVLGIDYSASFIKAADRLREQGSLPYRRIDQGALSSECIALAPPGIEVGRVRFEVGDACNLRAGIGRFDVALLANLLDRLPDPRRCLDRLPDLLNPGGQLVIASPFTWMTEYTPLENWLGGFERDGLRVESFQTLRAILAPAFEFQRELDLPFLIREHERKFQWSVSHAGIWKKRSQPALRASP